MHFHHKRKGRAALKLRRQKALAARRKDLEFWEAQTPTPETASKLGIRIKRIKQEIQTLEERIT